MILRMEAVLSPKTRQTELEKSKPIKNHLLKFQINGTAFTINKNAPTNLLTDNLKASSSFRIKPEGKRIMPETRFTSFPALSVDPICLHRRRMFNYFSFLCHYSVSNIIRHFFH